MFIFTLILNKLFILSKNTSHRISQFVITVIFFHVIVDPPKICLQKSPHFEKKSSKNPPSYGRYPNPRFSFLSKTAQITVLQGLVRRSEPVPKYSRHLVVKIHSKIRWNLVDSSYNDNKELFVLNQLSEIVIFGISRPNHTHFNFFARS